MLSHILHTGVRKL